MANIERCGIYSCQEESTDGCPDCYLAYCDEHIKNHPHKEDCDDCFEPEHWEEL